MDEKIKETRNNDQMTKEEENAVLERAKNDEEVMLAVYARYTPLLLCAVQQPYLQKAMTREEALAIARLAFVEAVHDYDTERGAHFPAFLKRRVEGALYSEFRKVRRLWERETHPDQRDDAPIAWDSIYGASGSGDNEDQLATHVLLEEAMRLLTPLEKEILRLLYWEDQTLATVGKRLHKTGQTIGAARRKILEKLRAGLEGNDGAVFA